MTTSNVAIRRVLLKRGTTAENLAYTGLVGELTLDTDLDTVRVHDGVTAGGVNILATAAQVQTLSNSISTITGIDTSLLANAATQQTQINTINANISAFQSYANATFGTSSYGNASVKTYLENYNGNIVPDSDNTRDLGSPTNQWRHVYTAGGSIYLDNIKLTNVNGKFTATKVINPGEENEVEDPEDSDATSELRAISELVNGEHVFALDETGNLTLNGQPYTPGGNANTGNVTFAGVKVIGAGTASGDGNGYSTLELVPDNNLYENHQYLVVDPTAPSHIHIRAGGTQDASNSELFLGGEKNHVRVNDYAGVRLQNERLVENFYYYSDPTFTSGSWYEDSGSFYLEFTTTDQTMINWFWEFGNNPQNRIVVNQNDTLIYGNWALSAGNDVYKLQVTTGPVTSPASVNTIEFQIFTTETNYLYVENGDFRVDVRDDIRMFGRDIFRLANYSPDEPIEITTNYSNNSQTWAFQPNGTLTFPDGSTQSTAYTGATPDNETLDSVTGRGAATTNNITVGAVITTDITNKLSAAVGTQVTGIRPPDGAGANLGYIWVPDETQISSLGDITGWTLTNSDGIFSTTVVQMRYDLGGSWAIQTADALIYTGTYTFTSPDYQAPQPLPVDINVGTNTWTFNTSGNLSVPGGITSTDHLSLDADYDAGYSVYIGNNHPTPGMLGGVVIGDTRGGFVDIITEKLIIGDTAVPASSTGAPGDLAGQVAFDSSYVYYCTANYGGTTYNVLHAFAEGTSANGVDNGYLVANTFQLPQVGWKVYYNGQVRTIDQVNSTGIPGFYVVFVDTALEIPGQATFAWGPAPVTNIWKRVAWSNDTW